MSQNEQKREYGEATALEIMRALGLSSHDPPKLARYARKCFEDGAAEQRRKDADKWAATQLLSASKVIEDKNANVAVLEARIAELEGTLHGQSAWHEARRKALSKQPQSLDTQWRMAEHYEQIEEVRAALTREGEV